MKLWAHELAFTLGSSSCFPRCADQPILGGLTPDGVVDPEFSSLQTCPLYDFIQDMASRPDEGVTPLSLDLPQSLSEEEKISYLRAHCGRVSCPLSF